MADTYTWLTEKITTISNGIQTGMTNSYQTCSTVASFIYQPVKKTVSYYATASARGFFDALYLPAHHLYNNLDLQTIWRETISNDLLYYFSQALLLKKGIDLARGYAPGYESSAIDLAMSTTAFLYLLHRRIQIFTAKTTDNLYHNKVIATITNKEREKHFKSCGDEPISFIQASVSSPIHYIGRGANVWLLHHLPGTEYLAMFYEMLHYGQSLIEYPISAVGNCTKHKTQLLVKNNAYCLGFGAAFLLTQSLTNYAIATTTGVRTSFTEDAVYYCLFSYFLIGAYTINHPLPGKGGTSIDFFYLSRVLSEKVTQSLRDRITAQLPERDINTNLVQTIKEMNESDYVKTLENLFFNNHIASLEEINKLPSLKKYLDLCEEGIRSFICHVNAIRLTPYLGHVPLATNYVLPIVPQFVLNKVQILKIIFDENTGPIFNALGNCMVHSRLEKLAEKNSASVLSEADKNVIVLQINTMIDRLKPMKEDAPDEHTLMLIQKIEAFQQLLLLIHNREEGTNVRKIILKWKQEHEKILNYHHQTFMQHFKETTSTTFIANLLAFIDKTESKTDYDDEELIEEVTKQIKTRIGALYPLIDAKKSEHFIRLEKITALENLKRSVEDFYSKVEFQEIVDTWKDYHWQIINAHRRVGATVSNKMNDLLFKNPEPKETKTAVFINKLLEDYGRYRRVANKSLNPVHEDESNKVLKSLIIKSISQKIDELKTKKHNEGYNKVLALQALIKEIDDISESILFKDLLKTFKVTYAPIINTHSSSGIRVANQLFTTAIGTKKIKTYTEAFIDKLEKDYGNTELRPTIKETITESFRPACP